MDEFISFLEIEVKDHKQMKEALEAFKAADINGDGKISKEEFIQSMSKFYEDFRVDFGIISISGFSRFLTSVNKT